MASLRVRTIVSVSTVCVLTAMAGRAAGQCSVFRLGVEDLDQRRSMGVNTAGLPFNGNSHCVPTSAANWLAYIGNHGYPNVLPVRNWQQQGQNYGDATEIMRQLGQMMGTTSGGTGYTKCSDVLADVLDDRAPGSFVSYRVGWPKGQAIQAADIWQGMSLGQVSSLGTVIWEWRGADPIQGLAGRYVTLRGGHACSINRVYNACSTSPEIYVRDPADPNDGLTVSQSKFRTKFVQGEVLEGFFETADGTFWCKGLRLIDPNNTAKISIITGLMVISPVFGLTADAQQGTFSVMNLHSPDDFSVMPPHTHTLPAGTTILDLEFHPQYPRVVMLTQLAGQDAVLGEYRPLTGGYAARMPIAGATDLATGRDGEAFVRSGNTIRRLDMSTSTPTEKGALSVPGAGAMSYDDRGNTLVVVIPSRGMIGMSSGAAFGQDYAETPIPAGIPVAGDACVAVSPVDGTIVLASSADDAIHTLARDASGGLVGARIATAQTISPRNVQVDHRGHIVFTSQGVVRELRQNPATGQWENDPNSKFAGTAAPDRFAQFAGRSSSDVVTNATNNGQDLQDVIEGVVVPECPTDFNGDAVVDLNDIFAFLNGWFGGNLRTDFNKDGTRDVNDIFAFLNGWFAGC